jgi:hypothetical protein
MRRTVAAFALAAITLLGAAMPAVAGRAWCRVDPQVTLNGTPIQMWVEIPAEYVPYVSGPVRTTISTPKEVNRQLIFRDTGFNGYGEDVNWSNLSYCALLLLCSPAKVAADGSFDVQVSTVVPINKNLLFNLLAARSIPLRLTIVFADGSTRVVEMTNDGAKIAVRLPGGN